MDNVVAVEILEESGHGRVWQRIDGEVVAHDVPFRPWLVSSFKAKQHGALVRQLQGENQIKWFHSYPNMENYQKAKHQHPYGKALIWEDMRQQFLGLNPEYRLFQNMRFDELTRLSFDIEATGLNPDKDEILMIAVSTDSFAYDIVGTEQEMLEEFENLILAIDPDTLEGYNIFGYDIPFMMNRAAKLGMELNWGRSMAEGDTQYASPVEIGKRWNFRIGSYEQKVQSYVVPGRHFVDGLMVAKRYDAQTQGQFESFGLKYLTKTMGISDDDRVYIDTSKIVELWNNDQERVRKYAVQDADETRQLIAMMVQPDFYVTTLLPDTYQNVLLAGNAGKINTLLVGEYLNENWSIPIPAGEREAYEGGAVECRLAGVFESVAKADVASLYPSIMLNHEGATPSQDDLKVFKTTLSDLTAKRLDLKRREQEELDSNKKAYLHGLNWAYKILINSFYGYLAVGMNFSDFEAAATVTRVGRDIVMDMADQLEAMGMTVIEVDTDGIYFQHDKDFPVEEIPYYLELPEWVVVEVEDKYDSMISIKAKNYVLKKPGKDTLIYHGNSLRSRRDEKFGRVLVDGIIKGLLSGDRDGITELYRTLQQRILDNDIPKDELAKRERISDTTFKSPAKAKLRGAIEGSDLKEGDYAYIYVTEDGSYKLIDHYKKGTADRFYYLDRLFKFGQRLSDVLAVYDISLPKMYKKEFNEILGIKPVRKTKKKEEVAA